MASGSRQRFTRAPFRRGRTPIGVSILAVTGLILVACGQAQGSAGSASGEFDFTGPTPSGEVVPVEERSVAPEFSGELLDGSAFDSTSLAGDIVVLNFWGSWCAPCRIETPEFQLVYEEVGAEGVQFLGVDVKDDLQLAIAFYADKGVEYPSLFDPRGEVALAFRGFPANAVPSTFLIDRDGRVAAVYTAAVAAEDLRSALSALLDEVS
jgi:thiol-disulfide isomerase/thioredoxin